MKLSLQAKRMIQVIIIFSIIVSILAGLYYRSQEVLNFLLGLALGAIASILRVLMVEKTVNKIVEGNKSPSSAQLDQLARLFVALLALLAGALIEPISLIGVIIGILSFQIATYFLKPTLSDKDKDNLGKFKSNENIKDEKEGNN